MCKTIYAEGISSSSKSFHKDDVSVDCDGMSFLIVVHDESPPTPGASKYMSNNAGLAIGNMLAVFGTDGTKVTLPTNANATKLPGAKNQAKDLLFGGKDVQLMEGEQCLLEKEILVIDTPVKIALHKDCAESIWHGVNRLNYPCELSKKEGICLKPVGNMPFFHEMINVILDSCYVPEAKKWIIHLGGVGGRLPLLRSSALQDLFKHITEVRNEFNCRVTDVDTGSFIQERITIEVAQIDLALNIPFNIPIRWGIDHKKKRRKMDDSEFETSYRSCFSNCKTDVWALHGLESQDGKIRQDNCQMGTVRFKNQDKRWNQNNQQHTNRPRPRKRRKNNSCMFDVLSSDEGCISKADKLLKKIYKVSAGHLSDLTSDEYTSHLEEPRATFSNMKAYSTVSHFVLRDRMSFPLRSQDIKTIPERSFIQLKRLLDKMRDTCSTSLSFVERFGVRARAEVSLRPTSTLRSEGHLVDFLALFCRVIDERFVVDPCLYVKTISSDTVYTEAMKNIGNVQAMLKFRNSELFCNKYPSGSCWLWLKANICYIMTLIGLAHHSKQSHINKLVGDSQRFDPFKLSEDITQHEVTPVEETQRSNTELYNELNNLITKLGISEAAVPVLLDYFCMQTPCSKKERRACFSELSLADKVILAYHLPETIIPRTIEFMIPRDSKPGVQVEMEAERVTEEIDDDEFLFGSELDSGNEFSNQMDIVSFFDPTRGFNNRMHESYLLMHLGDPPPPMKYYLEKNCEVPDASHPMVIVLYNLNELHSMLSEDTPSFLQKLVKFVNCCHENCLSVPGSKEPLNALESKFCPRSSRHCGPPKTPELLLEIKKLPMNTPPNSYTAQELLTNIARFYGFPCQGSAPPDQSYIDDCKEQHDGLNDLVNLVHNLGFVSELPPLKSKSQYRRYFLGSINAVVEIPRGKSLWKVDVCFPFATLKRGNFTKHIGMLEAISSKYAEFLGDFQPVEFLRENLGEEGNLCDMMIDEKGNNLRCFLPFLHFDSILSTHSNDTSFYEEYVLPLLSMVLQRNILVFDFETKAYKLRVFHERPPLVVTYLYSGRGVRPHLPSNFAKSSNIIDCFIKTNDKFVFVDELNEENVRTQHTQHPMILMSDGQPQGSIQKRVSLPLCLASLLSSTQYRHPNFFFLRGRTRLTRNIHDPLRIEGFLIELTRYSSPISDWLDKETIMNCLGSLGVDSFEKIRSNLFLREQRKPDVEAFLSIIVSCLKYKLFIVFYLEGESIFPYDSDDANQNKTTQVFYFDHVVSKVKRLSYQGLRRVRNLDHFIYTSIKRNGNNNLIFHYWTKVSNYLFPNKIEFYYNLLRSNCSYMDEFLFNDIIKKFKRDIGINNLFREEEIEIAHSFEAKDQATIVLLVIGKESTKTQQYIPLIFFKSDECVLCGIVLPSQERNNPTQRIQEELQSFALKLEKKCIQQIKYSVILIPELDFCSKSVSLLLAYIAHQTKSCDDLKNRLEEITSRERHENILAAWKKWLSEFTIYGPNRQIFNG
jgi:hypothetical protein